MQCLLYVGRKGAGPDFLSAEMNQNQNQATSSALPPWPLNGLWFKWLTCAGCSHRHATTKSGSCSLHLRDAFRHSAVLGQSLQCFLLQTFFCPSFLSPLFYTSHNSSSSSSSASVLFAALKLLLRLLKGLWMMTGRCWWSLEFQRK